MPDMSPRDPPRRPPAGRPRPTGAGRSIARWRRLGKLLPRDVRERVFYPAFADLTRAWLTRSGRHRSRPSGFGVRVVATWLRCLPIALPRLLLRDGRLTRAGRAVVWGGATALVVLLVVVNLQVRYGAYGP